MLLRKAKLGGSGGILCKDWGASASRGGGLGMGQAAGCSDTLRAWESPPELGAQGATPFRSPLPLLKKRKKTIDMEPPKFGSR